VTRPAVNHCTGAGGRGCPCEYHAWMRPRARRYAAQQRERKLAKRRMSARTCPRKFGRYGVCGAVIEADVVNGKLIVSCPACERFQRGICRDCPRPVAGMPRRSRRCAVHTALAATIAGGTYRTRHREVVNRKAKLFMRRPEVRARNTKAKRVWRQANPDKVRAQKVRQAQRRSPRRLAYHATYYATHRDDQRAQRIARHQGTAPLRTCVTPGCDIVLTGRKKKCTRCKARAVATARALLATRRAA
jgi:hypothetical protein